MKKTEDAAAKKKPKTSAAQIRVQKGEAPAPAAPSSDWGRRRGSLGAGSVWAGSVWAGSVCGLGLGQGGAGRRRDVAMTALSPSIAFDRGRSGSTRRLRHAMGCGQEKEESELMTIWDYLVGWGRSDRVGPAVDDEDAPPEPGGPPQL